MTKKKSNPIKDYLTFQVLSEKDGEYNTIKELDRNIKYDVIHINLKDSKDGKDVMVIEFIAKNKFRIAFLDKRFGLVPDGLGCIYRMIELSQATP